MLNFLGKTKIMDSKEFPIVSGFEVAAEGMALINYLDNGVEKVKPCNGTDAGKFVGFSYGQSLTPIYKTAVELVTVPASPGPYTTTLTHTPVSTAHMSVVNSVPTEQVSGTPGALSANEYSWVSGTTLTHHSGQAGLVMTVTYKYAPTVLELMFMDKVTEYSFSPSGVTGSIGAIIRGEVYTDQFDANAVWTATSDVKLGLLGQLTDQGSGTQLTVTIIHVPTVDIPFLGIRF